MLDNDHPSFTPPADYSTLWRYTNITKLLRLLESETLYFPRVDQLKDPYEGALSNATVREMRLIAQRSGNATSIADAQVQQMLAQREATYVSCWFASEHESAAMWSLYCSVDEGVAIRTTHAALVAELAQSPLTIRTSTVQYVDYDNTVIPFHNGFNPFLHKRMSFAHENEVRAVVWSAEAVNQPLVRPGSLGLGVTISPANLLSAVHVSPNASPWFGELVEALLRRYGLATPVVRSGLYERPTY